jgi:hypothetical protein
MYHGTDAENLPIIMSQGLIPNPKKRVWQQDEHASFYQPSRSSLPGIYLTTNLMTALSSAGKGKTKEDVLVLVRVSSGTLLADEDDVKFRLNSAISDHPYSVMQLYTGWQALKQGLIADEWGREETRKYLETAQSTFMENNLKSLNTFLKGGLNGHETNLVLPLLEKAFYITLTRKASHVEKYSWGYSDHNYGIPIPSSSLAESDFKALEDRLTRLLKRMGRPEHLNDAMSPTARIETPITFSGRNKIVAVLHEFGYGLGKGRRVRVVYPSSGHVPPEFIRDWTERMGPWDPV